MSRATQAMQFRSPVFRAGVVALLIAAIILLLLAYKAPIQSMLRSGDEVTATFERDYGLKPHETKVKVAGLEVGIVRGVEPTDDGHVDVRMKVDRSALEVIGPEPTAVIAPLTVLGGQFAVELERGGGAGHFDGGIPVQSTRLPVELDRILEALPSETRGNVQDLVGTLEGTLEEDGRRSLSALLDQAPGTLDVGGQVLEGAQGTRPGDDLPEIVQGLHATAAALTANDGQLEAIVRDLDRTTDALASGSSALAETFSTLEPTLQATQTAMPQLRGTLQQLEVTARSARPVAPELSDLLDSLDPVLVEARPLLADLDPLLEDARPAVDELVPAVVSGNEVLDDVGGPVMDRLRGPVVDWLMNPWRGEGPYRNSGRGVQANNRVYEEVGYLGTNLVRSSMTRDAQGALLSFQAGAGTGSIGGTPLTYESLLQQLYEVIGLDEERAFGLDEEDPS